eukprot:5782887-Amphidinium_carterae.1
MSDAADHSSRLKLSRSLSCARCLFGCRAINKAQGDEPPETQFKILALQLVSDFIHLTLTRTSCTGAQLLCTSLKQLCKPESMKTNRCNTNEHT